MVIENGIHKHQNIDQDAKTYVFILSFLLKLLIGASNETKII